MSSVFTRVMNVTVLLWSYQYLLKNIPVDEFAVYPVILSIIVFAPLFFALFGSGISRYVVAEYAQGNFNSVREIVSSIFPFILLSCIFFLFAAVYFSINVDKFLDISPEMIETAQTMVLCLAVNYALQMVLAPFTVGYHVKQKFVELNAIGVLRDIIRIVLLLILLINVGPAVIWIVVATVFADVAHLIVVVLRSAMMVPELRFQPRLFAWRTATKLMSFGVWTTLGQLGSIIYINAATIILNKYGSALDVTVYYLGSTIYRQIHGMIAFASQPIQPALTAMHSTNDHALVASAALRAGRFALWASLLIGTSLAIYSTEFVRLYVGEAFSSSSTIIVLFMLIFPFTHATVLLPMTAIAAARVKAFFIGFFLSQVISLTLTYYAAAHYGFDAVGVTLILTVTTILSQLLYFWPLHLKLAQISKRQFVIDVLVFGYLPAILASPIWITLKWTVMPDSWISLGLCAIAGGAVYLFTLIVFCLNSDDRSDLRAILRKLNVVNT